jgi:hypothetical protein
MVRAERAAGFYVGDRGRRSTRIQIAVVLVTAAREFFPDFAEQRRGSSPMFSRFALSNAKRRFRWREMIWLVFVSTTCQVKTSSVVGKTRKWIAAMIGLPIQVNWDRERSQSAGE